MNKEQIKSKMQSIEESIKEQTNELNKLRLEMDKPEKPTLEEMCKGEIMYFPAGDGCIHSTWVYRKDGYLSRERAEKELLRIRLSVIADYLNGGLFEPANGEKGYILLLERNSNTVAVGDNTFYSYGKINFKTEKLAEQAMTYFTNEELIKLLK